MTTTFFSSRVWTTLQKAVRREKAPADVAVAYFAAKAASMLPLAEGSALVVDASELSVKSGRTCPAELGKMVRRGIRVFSAPNLHAKVFVFRDRAFVGSTNVSRNSKNVLIEAGVVTTDRQVVSDARKFVRSLCVQSLGPAEIARLQKLYRPPKFEPQAPRGHRKRSRIALPRVRVVHLVVRQPPPESEGSAKVGRAVAKQRMERPRSHTLQEFFWEYSCSMKRGETVVQIVEEPNGRMMVEPPGKVLYIQRWSSRAGLGYWVYVEAPVGRRVELRRFARRIGRGAKKRLERNGLLSFDFSERVRAGWYGGKA